MMRQRTVEAFDEAAWKRNPSGLYVPNHVKPRRTYPIAIDLFCGAGGFSLGIIQGGFQVIAGLDNDAWSALTYMHNLGGYPIQIIYDTPESQERLEKCLRQEIKRWEKAKERAKEDYPDDWVFLDEVNRYQAVLSGGGWRSYHGEEAPPVLFFFFGDVRNFQGELMLQAMGLEVGEVDLIVGGPPCQGFSRAGKRNVMDPRNSLVFEFARLIVEIQPKMMCMENVPDLATMVTPEGVSVIDAFCLALQQGGFGTLDALKRSLLSHPDARAAVKQITKVSKPQQPEPTNHPVQGQLF